MRRNLDEHVRAVVGIAPDNYGAVTATGASIDTLGHNESMVVLNVGVIGPTAGSRIDVRVQESSDGITWVDIAGAAFATVTAARHLTVFVGRVRLATGIRRRFIRVVGVSVLGGTDTANDYGVTVLLSKAASLPVSQVNAVAYSV